MFADSRPSSSQGTEFSSFEGPFISPYFQMQCLSYCVQWQSTLHPGSCPNCRGGEHNLLSTERNEADGPLSWCDSQRTPHHGDLRLSKWPPSVLSSKRVTVNHFLKWCGHETSRWLLSWPSFPGLPGPGTDLPLSPSSQTAGFQEILTEVEILAVIVGCLCHDLDHRGTNNAFQAK